MPIGEEKISLREFAELTDVDLQTGMSLCMNNPGLYMDIIKEFHNEDKRQLLDQYFNNQDWENYRIEVHALKNNFRTIGADVQAEFSLQLEMACKNNEFDYCYENHSKYMEEYIRVWNAAGRL